MSIHRFGMEMERDTSLSSGERLYVRLLGVPILGMRIRARHLTPLIEQLRSATVTRIADAGSGRGSFAFHLARTFPTAEITGYDLNRQQVDANNRLAKQLGVRNCRFETKDITDWPDTPTYDLIVSTDNLEHLTDDQRQCDAFLRSLNPGGRILFHVPHLTRNLFGWHRTNFMGIEGHVRPGYIREGLADMLKASGFKVEKALYTYNSFETLANDLSYLITGGRERRKALYALAFPFLLALSRLGRRDDLSDGSGLMVLAQRPVTTSHVTISSSPLGLTGGLK